VSAILVAGILSGVVCGVAGYVAGILSERRFHELERELDDWRAQREERGKRL
jgi:hypothetical protein